MADGKGRRSARTRNREHIRSQRVKNNQTSVSRRQPAIAQLLFRAQASPRGGVSSPSCRLHSARTAALRAQAS
eukprot:6701066-Heterocapsa_arctica.AAC.1